MVKKEVADKDLIDASTSTKPDVLRDLAKSSRIEVRWAVAGNKCCPADALHYMAINSDNMEPNDQLHTLTLTIIHNENTSGDTLREMSKAKDINYRLFANPNLPKDVMLNHEHDRWSINWLLRNPEVCEEILERFSYSKTRSTRVDVARHQNTPLKILYRLACDEDETVRKVAADRL